MFLRLILCAVIGMYGVKGQFTACPKNILDEIDTCISNSVDFTSFSSATVFSYYNNPTAAFCSKKTELTTLINCVYDAALKCFDDRFKEIFPTHEQNEKTLTYLCTRIDSYDTDCILNSLGELVSCVLEGLGEPSISNYEDMKSYICGSQRNGKKCITDSTELDKCPETKKTYLELSKLQNPEACGGEAGFESGVFSSAPPLYQSVVLLIAIMLMKFIF